MDRAAVRARQDRRRSSSPPTPRCARRDIEYLLRQSEAATLVTIRGFRDVDYIAELDAIGATPATIPGARAADLHPRRGRRACRRAGLHARTTQLRDAAPRVSDAELDARSAAVGVDDVINMQYTSGTTGFPKGVMLSSRNIVNNGEALGRGARLHAGRSAVPVRAAVSLFRLRHRRARRLHARRLPLSGGVVRSRGSVLETDPSRALHRALRRADDVHRRARASGLRAIRPVRRCGPA